MLSGLENPTHLLFIAIIAIIFLGPKRLPEVGRSLGSGLRSFKDAISGETHSTSEDATASVNRPESS